MQIKTGKRMRHGNVEAPMQYFIVGLGNPGEAYKDTRHNAGRIVLEYFRKKHGFSEWEEEKKLKGLIAEGKVGKHKVLLVTPETFMNNSGKSVAPLIKKKADLERLIVVYDELDMPLGKLKISYNRSSGGHNGLESIIKSVKSPAFARLRVGISPATPLGKLKKPSGDKAVHDFIIGNFKERELDVLKKVAKQTNDALEFIITEGREKAMGKFN